LIISADAISDATTLEADLAVVGAGPAGITVAVEAARQGFEVILVESGDETARPDAQRLADAANWDRSLHGPMSESVRRQLGGSSTVWGGRCVPYDRVDFERRAYIGPVGWPVTYEEVSRYHQRASDWLGCGRPAFDVAQMPHLPPAIVPGLAGGMVGSASFERWTLSPNFALEYGGVLRKSPRIRVVTNLTCTAVLARVGDQRASELTGRSLDGRHVSVRARAFVLACGGLDTTRLMLASRDETGGALGDHSGHLGCWYMGHVSGVIAQVRFNTPPRATVYGFERDTDGTPVRRRLSIADDVQLKYELPNAIGFLANPEMADPRHRNAVLSLAHLALRSPLGERIAPGAQRARVGAGLDSGQDPRRPDRGSIAPHLFNVVRDLPAVARFAAESGARRVRAKGHKPAGLFAAYSAENRYPFQYHGEHLPSRESRVTLADERDAAGMPRLNIGVKFSQRDVDGILRCHEIWDKQLREQGCGQLEYRSADPDQLAWSELGAGTHQLGTTRMSTRPEDGVVDENLAVHGIGNLFVASTSVMPTAGQANPTFMLIALAVRLADHLKDYLSALGVLFSNIGCRYAQLNCLGELTAQQAHRERDCLTRTYCTSPSCAPCTSASVLAARSSFCEERDCAWTEVRELTCRADAV
jgi:choline dehydrogenase-like flavoprotein